LKTTTSSEALFLLSAAGSIVPTFGVDGTGCLWLASSTVSGDEAGWYAGVQVTFP
jgi:hypothetical protein